MVLGDNTLGQLGDGTKDRRLTPTEIRDFTAVSVGSSHSCALAAAGAAFCWGFNGSGQLGNGTTMSTWWPTRMNGTWTAISAGDDHSCGIRATQTVWCWGDNSSGQLGDGSYVNRLADADLGDLAGDQRRR